ncbi:MAG: hypothetical protein DRJ03_21265 [Chloroflexi bacterium]|nr:MAG: hypothetical protein DRJ03_21265 [Chloroflexota bacterium]
MIFDNLDPAYVKGQLDKLSNLNTTLTNVRDAISGGKSLSDIYGTLYNTTDGKSVYDQAKAIYGQLDVALSTRASESTLSGIKSQTDKLTFDSNDYLYVVLGGSSTVNIGNFPSWFTSSTKTTDDLYGKLNALAGALGSVASDKLRATIVDALPAGTNWIGSVKIGDGSSAVGVINGTLGGSTKTLLGVAPDLVKMYAGGTNYVDSEVSVTTTESSSSFSPALKFALITNTGDDDVLIRFNGSSATQKKIPAHTSKAVLFPISSIYYEASTSSSTLRIEGVW